MKCSSNIKADTVLEAFVRATEEFGIPCRVRTDLGGENVRVWDYMEEVRGSNRGSYIIGSSIHDARIERLWHDVYVAVSESYISTFRARKHWCFRPTKQLTLFLFTLYIHPEDKCQFMFFSVSME